jgi:hypothetical protein
MSKAISGLPIAETLTGDELLPVVQDGNTVQSTVQQMVDLVGNTTTWGYIQGTLSNQTDLQNALNLKVPYTGATTNVNLGEYGLTSGFFQADLTPTGTLQVGRMMWSDQDGTMDLRLLGNNVTLHIGQKQVIRVVNKTGATLTGTDYQVVKISGAQGQRPKVSLAQADNDANSADTIGMVNETIANNQEGFVCTSGTITNINTTGSMQGETWADGDVLYLSGTTAGRVTNIKPTAPIHTVIVGFVIYAHINQGKIYVKVDNGYELDELHNVRITSPSNGQVLTYNSGLWENQTNGSGTVTSVAATAGTGISVSGSPITSSGTLTITNTAPDQVVSLTAGSNVTITGTYPSFTIAATGGGGGSGTVTDVSVVSANGFSGSVATSTTTPAITLSTSISGLLKGSSGALAAASATDVPDLPQSKITNLVTDLSAKAPLASPTFTGTPTAPTASVGTNTTQVATTAFVQAEIANDAVLLTGDQTVAGTKTFSSTISGSITGNAGTATTLQTTRSINLSNFNGSANITVPRVFALDDRTIAPADGSANYVTAYFTSWANDNTSPYADALLFRTYSDGSGGNDNLVTFRKNAIGMRIWQQTAGSATAFASFKDVAWTDGTNATGTWSISTSGNAGTVTNGVYTTGDQTIAGVKTFSGTSTIVNGNLGIGTASPINKLTISGSSLASGELGTFAITGNTTAKRLAMGVDSTSTMYGWIQSVESGVGYRSLVLQQLGGILGVGSIPSAWSGLGGIGAIQTPSSAIVSSPGGGTNTTTFVTNAFYNGTNWIYRNTAATARYDQWGNEHRFFVAASGTAGNAITYTQAMTLNSSGNLSVTGNMDATIFRDVSNTAFYLDPANSGTSLNINGIAVIGAGSTVGGVVIGYRDVPVTTQNATYTFALTDAGKSVGKDNATAYTYTIPANASVAFPVGTVITVFNNNATNNITIAITTDTLRLAGTTSTGSRTVAPFGLCTLFKVSSTVWMASGSGVS